MITPHFDVTVIGAGPAGCEAALASARAGASTLCLTINLDMVGYPPATPVLVDDAADRRHAMLAELDAIGGQLPRLIQARGVADTDNVDGRLLIDRRRLGLAWKELIENEDRVVLRQTLVTDLAPAEKVWRLMTGLGEKFTAASVVVAAGTFLHGRVLDGSQCAPGGRWAEIPANSLAKSLQNMGIELVEVSGRTSPRLCIRGLDPATLADPRLQRDGAQLDEVYAFGFETGGSRSRQLQAVRQQADLARSWITRASYAVLHLVLAAEGADEALEVIERPGLFFAGRAAGSCNYSEAAVLGFIAGKNAALRAGFGVRSPLTKDYELVTKLLARVAHKTARPVTVRIDEETGC